MSQDQENGYQTELKTKSKTVLELTVNNHPGVMAHICGLFARRAFNVEGILCMPIGDGSRSRIWLLLNEDQVLEQVENQLLKQVDVLDLRDHGTDISIFHELAEHFKI